MPVSKPKRREESGRTVTVEYKRKKKPKSSSSGGSSRKSSSKRRTRDRDREDAYVYDDDDDPPSRAADRDDRPRSACSSRSQHSTLSNQDDLPSVLEEEVTPADSISQVAFNGPPPRHRASAKRHTLPPISEQSSKPPPPSPPRRPANRNSLLDTLFRRKSTPAPPSPRLTSCLTCGSDDVPVPRTAKLACGHTMCHACLRRLFRLAVTDPSHMPPRCCTSTPIPLSHVEHLFDTKFKITFNKKFDENSTKDRVYCPAPRCGTWIRPAHFHTSSSGKKYATCPRCRTKVCTLCSARSHKSADCPSDPEIARLVAQAQEEGWQRCYNCHAMVELREGCNHMKCRCTAEFCMVCGSKWKSCECPWFNYANLPDPDRLRDMRVPEDVQVVYRRVFDAQAARPGGARAPAVREIPVRRGEFRVDTYAEEVEARRRQERLDEDLARRMQYQNVMDAADRTRHRYREETIGLGNAAGHHLNEDFRRSGRGPGAPSMAGFGDEAMGRRGERSSGRRREVRRSAPPVGGGLPGDFLGSESILGFGPGGRRVGMRS